MKRLLFILIFCTACSGSQKPTEPEMHTPPEEGEETPITTIEKEETPVEEPEFPEARIRLVDETGKTRLHVDAEGGVIAKGQRIGMLRDEQYTDAKGRVVMETKGDKLMSGTKELGAFSKDGLSVTTEFGMVGLDENGMMVSHIQKTSEVFRSEWRFPDVDKSERRHAVILAIVLQHQIPLKAQK